jgi:hypothetical protein
VKKACLMICLTVLALPAAAAPPPEAVPAKPPTTAGPAAAPAAPVEQPAPDPAVELGVLRQDNARLTEQLERLTQAAKDAPVIDRENQQLRERLITLETQRERLTNENQALASWRGGLKTGAIIFLAGLAVGWLMGRGRRQGSWSDI